MSRHIGIFLWTCLKRSSNPLKNQQVQGSYMATYGYLRVCVSKISQKNWTFSECFNWFVHWSDTSFFSLSTSPLFPALVCVFAFRNLILGILVGAILVPKLPKISWTAALSSIACSTEPLHKDSTNFKPNTQKNIQKIIQSQKHKKQYASIWQNDSNAAFKAPWNKYCMKCLKHHHDPQSPILDWHRATCPDPTHICLDISGESQIKHNEWFWHLLAS